MAAQDSWCFGRESVEAAIAAIARGELVRFPQRCPKRAFLSCCALGGVRAPTRLAVGAAIVQRSGSRATGSARQSRFDDFRARIESATSARRCAPSCAQSTPPPVLCSPPRQPRPAPDSSHPAASSLVYGAGARTWDFAPVLSHALVDALHWLRLFLCAQVVVVDDEDRENEGDLIMAVSHCCTRIHSWSHTHKHTPTRAEKPTKAPAPHAHTHKHKRTQSHTNTLRRRRRPRKQSLS